MTISTLENIHKHEDIIDTENGFSPNRIPSVSDAENSHIGLSLV
jgi:hypothetical protein